MPMNQRRQKAGDAPSAPGPFGLGRGAQPRAPPQCRPGVAGGMGVARAVRPAGQRPLTQFPQECTQETGRKEAVWRNRILAWQRAKFSKNDFRVLHQNMYLLVQSAASETMELHLQICTHLARQGFQMRHSFASRIPVSIFHCGKYGKLPLCFASATPL
ncbi:uncharacterized protein LOC144263144 [Eretmochelys imbricata]